MTTRIRHATTPPFVQYQLDHAYDEMFDPDGHARPAYNALYQRVLEFFDDVDVVICLNDCFQSDCSELEADEEAAWKEVYSDD